MHAQRDMGNAIYQRKFLLILFPKTKINILFALNMFLEIEYQVVDSFKTFRVDFDNHRSLKDSRLRIPCNDFLCMSYRNMMYLKKVDD